jgi:periplasmic glucans biosynthesis protein
MISRRELLALSAAALAMPKQTHANETAAYSFDTLLAEARQLAALPAQRRDNALPQPLSNLDFDAWRDIRFKPDRAISDALDPYQLQLFHRGFLYRDPVTISLLDKGSRVPLVYDPLRFDFGRTTMPDNLPLDFGHAGFRLHYPLNTGDWRDEIISFLGASYFRFLSIGQHYGLSARALAINAGIDGEAEEFPYFRSFVIHPPAEKGQITIDALIDSASLTAAFSFELTPGIESVVDVTAHVFARQTVTRLGLAPLTSMFLHGEGGGPNRLDHRPELHDSDGLLMKSGTGEWIWRPLQNPSRATLSRFADAAPKGFGLMQRDRLFEHYQDLDLNYHQRPSYWIEPQGDWGKGHVVLAELPTTDETNDNIVAYWQPGSGLEAGKTISFRYRMRALDGRNLSPRGYALNSFRTLPRALGSQETIGRGSIRFLIDFAGGPLEAINPQSVMANVTIGNGRLLRQSVVANKEIRGMRAAFDVAGEPGSTIDLRVFLQDGQDALTETWTLAWAVPD